MRYGGGRWREMQRNARNVNYQSQKGRIGTDRNKFVTDRKKGVTDRSKVVTDSNKVMTDRKIG
jgi:hypothetical protein